MNNYLGGMKCRLFLVIFVFVDLDVLILDELIVGIDLELRKMIWVELGDLKVNGKCIFVMIYVMDEVEKCDRFVMIRNG